MSYFFFMREGHLRDAGMQKFHGVSNDDGLCLCIDYQESAIVFKVWNCVEAVTATLVP